MQVDIVIVATSLAQTTKIQPSVTIVGAFSDMMRHLRKSIHCSLDDSNLGEEVIQWNRRFQEAVHECLVQMSQKVNLRWIFFHPQFLFKPVCYYPLYA